LTSDIDASETESWNGGNGFNPLGTFSGTFHGKGHVITGLYMSPVDGVGQNDGIGLFGKLKSGQIKDVGLESAEVISNVDASNIGILVGIIRDSGTVERAYTSGEVSVPSANSGGGLIGLMFLGGTVEKSIVHDKTRTGLQNAERA